MNRKQQSIILGLSLAAGLLAGTGREARANSLVGSQPCDPGVVGICLQFAEQCPAPIDAITWCDAYNSVWMGCTNLYAYDGQCYTTGELAAECYLQYGYEAIMLCSYAQY